MSKRQKLLLAMGILAVGLLIAGALYQRHKAAQTQPYAYVDTQTGARAYNDPQQAPEAVDTVLVLQNGSELSNKTGLAFTAINESLGNLLVHYGMPAPIQADILPGSVSQTADGYIYFAVQTINPSKLLRVRVLVDGSSGSLSSLEVL